MKTLQTVLLIGALAANIGWAGETCEADQKWKEAVERMISSGKAQISTPSEQRVQIAKALAEKYGHQCQTVKTESGYRVIIKSSEVADH